MGTAEMQTKALSQIWEGEGSHIASNTGDFRSENCHWEGWSDIL